jgi:hypothetical protein
VKRVFWGIPMFFSCQKMSIFDSLCYLVLVHEYSWIREKNQTTSRASSISKYNTIITATTQ